jgi:hypothetical protein
MEAGHYTHSAKGYDRPIVTAVAQASIAVSMYVQY